MWINRVLFNQAITTKFAPTPLKTYSPESGAITNYESPEEELMRLIKDWVFELTSKWLPRTINLLDPSQTLFFNKHNAAPSVTEALSDLLLLH